MQDIVTSRLRQYNLRESFGFTHSPAGVGRDKELLDAGVSAIQLAPDAH